MDNTIILQGRFTSDGIKQVLPLRSGCDWIETYNYTQALAAQIGAVGVKFYWQSGMPVNSAFETTKGIAGAAGEFVVTTGGFTPFDTSVNVLGPLNTDVTAISNAAIPVVTETSVNGLAAGDVVRLTNIAGGRQLGGMDFTVGYSTLTAGTFSLEYMPQIVAATTGNWQKVNWQAPFYPRRRVITAISNAVNAVVRLSVKHEFVVGEQIRISVPSTFGMTIAPTQATIIAINTATAATGNTITLDLDTSALAPFVFPTTAVGALGFTPAQIVPVGENTAAALAAGADILYDATRDLGGIGMVLAGGVDSPAGQNGDVIYWKAGKSFSV